MSKFNDITDGRPFVDYASNERSINGEVCNFCGREPVAGNIGCPGPASGLLLIKNYKDESGALKDHCAYCKKEIEKETPIAEEGHPFPHNHLPLYVQGAKEIERDAALSEQEEKDGTCPVCRTKLTSSTGAIEKNGTFYCCRICLKRATGEIPLPPIGTPEGETE